MSPALITLATVISLADLSPWQAMLLVVATAGVVSYGLIEILKRAHLAHAKETPRTDDDKEVWWWKWIVLRGGAVALGTGVGALWILTGVQPILSLLLGTAGGILNTSIYAGVMARIKKGQVGLDDEESCDDDKGKGKR